MAPAPKIDYDTLAKNILNLAYFGTICNDKIALQNLTQETPKNIKTYEDVASFSRSIFTVDGNVSVSSYVEGKKDELIQFLKGSVISTSCEGMHYG